MDGISEERKRLEYLKPDFQLKVKMTCSKALRIQASESNSLGLEHLPVSS